MEEVIEIRTKVCYKCGVEKDIGEFSRRSSSKDGHDGLCKLCHAQYMKIYAEQNKEKRREYCKEHREHLNSSRRKYNAEHKDHVKTLARKYYQNADRERIKVNQKKNYEKNKEDILIKAKIYYQENRDKILKNVQHYFERNKGKIMIYHNDYFKNRYKVDIGFRLVESLRKRMLSAIKNGYKSDFTINLLGCSIEEIKMHIENHFTEGMTWQKFLNGEIHLDHIRPLITYDLTDEEQQRQAFNWQNIAPLWAIDNLTKGCKWDGVVNRYIDTNKTNVKNIYIYRFINLMNRIKEA